MIVKETDEAFIRSVASHKKVWKYVSLSDEVKDYDLPNGVYYTLVKDGVKAGFMAFLQEDTCISAHIAVLPEYRGKWLISDIKQAFLEIGSCKARISLNNLKAYALAVKCGMRLIDKTEIYYELEI